MNDAADFWCYEIGVNVIPADTRNEVTSIRWAEYQHSPISEEQHNKWKADNAFNKGIAIILGRIWHNRQKSNLYINAIDCDNICAVREICSYKGKQLSLQELANWTLVEQHKDSPDKMHVIVYSRRPFLTKGSDKNNPKYFGIEDASKIPALEVKSTGTMLFVSPSYHKGGYRYEILGIKDPVICDEFEKHIDSICRKYGIPYLDADNGDGKSEVPIDELFEEDFTIYEGHNRHGALLRVMESLIKNNRSILSEETLKYIAHEWNEKHCKPPLDDTQFYKQWQDAKDFIARKKREEEERKSYYQKTLEEVEQMSLEEKISYLLGSINKVHPEEMVEKFRFKCLLDTRELRYYDNVKGAYVENGEILLEQELEANQISMNKTYAKSGCYYCKVIKRRNRKITGVWYSTIQTRKAMDQGFN
jgi:hypothetical protein